LPLNAGRLRNAISSRLAFPAECRVLQKLGQTRLVLDGVVELPLHKTSFFRCPRTSVWFNTISMPKVERSIFPDYSIGFRNEPQFPAETLNTSVSRNFQDSQATAWRGGSAAVRSRCE
jgi:hypothetical protein